MPQRAAEAASSWTQWDIVIHEELQCGICERGHMLICTVCMGAAKEGDFLKPRVTGREEVPLQEEATEAVLAWVLSPPAPRVGEVAGRPLRDRVLRRPPGVGSLSPSACTSSSMPLSGCCAASSASSCRTRGCGHLHVHTVMGMIPTQGVLLCRPQTGKHGLWCACCSHMTIGLCPSRQKDCRRAAASQHTEQPAG